MSDPLFLRAQRAIEENRAAREERRLLLIEHEDAQGGRAGEAVLRLLRAGRHPRAA